MRIHPRFILSGLALAAVGLLPVGIEAQEASPIAEYRTTVMQGIRHHFGALRALTGGAVELPSHVVHHARSLEALSSMTQDIFPAGSGGEATRALPAIWEDRDDFQEKVRAFQSAAESLRRAAEAGDADGVEGAVQDVRGSCGDCHSDYRADSGGE